MMISSNITPEFKTLAPTDLPASHRFGCSAGWAAKTATRMGPQSGLEAKAMMSSPKTDATPVDRLLAESKLDDLLEAGGRPPPK